MATQQNSGSEALDTACMNAISKICGHLEPPIYVEDFMANSKIVKFMGTAHHINLTREVAQQPLNFKWLREFLLSTRNTRLMVAIARLSGEIGGSGGHSVVDVSEMETMQGLLEIAEQECKHAIQETEMSKKQSSEELHDLKDKVYSFENQNMLLQQQLETTEEKLLNHRTQVDNMRLELERTKQDHETTRFRLEQVMSEFGLRSDADKTMRELHSETNRLHFRLSKQKQQVMQPIEHLREDNRLLAENFVSERRSSVVAHSQVAELEMALGDRDAAIDGLRAELRIVAKERDNLVAFTVELLGKDQLKDALRDTKVRTSWAKSKMMEEDE
jgi:chromosome segregation ATPase